MPQFCEIKKFILCLYKGIQIDSLLVGQKEMFSNPYEDDAFISFDDSEISINWKGVTRLGKTNIPTGEIKVSLLLSHGMLLMENSAMDVLRKFYLFFQTARNT